MHKPLLLLTLLLPTSTVLGQQKPVSTFNTGDFATLPVKLSVEPLRSKYFVGVPVPLQVRMDNTFVPGPGAMGTSTFLPGEVGRSLEVSVTGPDGATLSRIEVEMVFGGFKPKQNLFGERPRLEVGKSATDTLRLDQFYALREPGEYEVRLNFVDPRWPTPNPFAPGYETAFKLKIGVTLDVHSLNECRHY